eukprot:scaffold7349_cov173-Amphora_coffeaeformis.AAC.49
MALCNDIENVRLNELTIKTMPVAEYRAQHCERPLAEEHMIDYFWNGRDFYSSGRLRAFINQTCRNGFYQISWSSLGHFSVSSLVQKLTLLARGNPMRGCWGVPSNGRRSLGEMFSP